MTSRKQNTDNLHGLEHNAPAVEYLDTTAAYDRWAEVYDTDGNFLQALDSMEMKTLLPQLLSFLPINHSPRIVDLGCGTGRNTSALLRIPDSTVIGLDASSKMLNVARKRLEEVQNSTTISQLRLEVYDLLKQSSPPNIAHESDAIISTLVLEHVPLEPFFFAVSRMLKQNGVLLLTNMHFDMGVISQAGFIDPRTKVKIRPQSYAHEIKAVTREAKKHGFELLGSVTEKTISADLAAQLGPRAKKWIGVTVWFGVMLRKTVPV